MTRKPFHCIDASVFVFRAHFAMPNEFFDREQMPVHAVQGFLNFMLSFLQEQRPSHLLVAFDGALNSSFRNQIFPAYKANRDPPDAVILRQFEYCVALSKLLGLASYIDQDFEADDLIASAIWHARAQGFCARIATADKDLSQLLLDEQDAIIDPQRKTTTSPRDVKQKFGVPPTCMVDYLALAGDAVDNVPGVKGIGEKTAATLLSHFGSLDALLARVDELPFLRIRGAASLALKLKEQRDAALMSRALVALSTNAPVSKTMADYQPQKPDLLGLNDLLEQLNFGPLTRRRVREYAEGFY